MVSLATFVAYGCLELFTQLYRIFFYVDFRKKNLFQVLESENWTYNRWGLVWLSKVTGGQITAVELNPQ